MSMKDALSQSIDDMANPVGITLSVSYATAEWVGKSREVAPFYFDHVGNASVAMMAAVATNAFLANKVESMPPRAARVVGLATAMAVNTAVECAMSGNVHDPKDFAYGVGGAVAGYLSMRRKKPSGRHRAER